MHFTLSIFYYVNDSFINCVGLRYNQRRNVHTSKDIQQKSFYFNLNRHPTIITDGRFLPGQGSIWLNNVQCWGTEEDIAECEFNQWGQNNCSHSQDVGISCGN